MQINYDLFDPKIRNTIRNIESKPHVKYIRYLLTKRYSPISIKKELQRLALSAPHEQPLTVYYLAVIDPLVTAHGLGHVYASYKNKLLRKNKKNDFSNHILKFRLEFSDSPDDQVRFCKFVTDLEIDECWNTEIMRFYGTADQVPLDENGNRVIKTTTNKRSLDKILCHPKRYLIDKLILENVPYTRIAEYCRKQFKFNVFPYDIAYYKKIFFNIQTKNIEEKIHSLEAEQNSLKSFLEVIDNDDNMNLGEKIAVKKQTEERLKELEDNIKTLNALFSEAACNQLIHETEDFEKIFLDIVTRGYKRFQYLDQYMDRDVVDPLFKVARMMGYAYEKAADIKDGNLNGKDKHSQAQLMELYRKRVDEMYGDQNIKEINKIGNEILANTPKDEILGIDELNIMADEDQQNENNK